MGTIAQKIARSLDTKEGLKNTINTYLGQDITSAIPFKDYETYIKNFYGELPKTDYAEGSNITLSNTLKGKLDFEDDIVGYGDTQQNGTPTPSTPITINSVTGNQDVVVSGKNLLDVSKNTNGYVLSNTGELNATANFCVSDYIPVQPNTEYSTSYNIVASGQDNVMRVGLYDSSKTFISRPTSANNPYAFTTPSNCYFIRLSYHYASKENIMLEEGSTATDYEPYITPTSYQLRLGNIELCKIGNYQDYLYKSNGKWYKKEYIYKIANKTNWVVGNMASNNRAVFGLVANGFLSAVNIYSGINCISNSFIAVSQGTQGTTTNINNIAVNNSNIYIKFADTINTRELAKAQLDSMTNLAIYYILATATDTEITDTTLIEQLNNWYNSQSFTGTTILEVDGDLPLIIKTRALKGA